MTDEEYINAAINQLKWSLQCLAQPAEVQPTLFPNFVVVTDELALEFDNWYHATIWRDEFTVEQKLALTAIDEFLHQMTIAKDTELWDLESLSCRDEWQAIRRLSVLALDAFGWDTNVPPQERAVYVQASPSRS